MNTFHSTNQNFDSTLHALYPMALLAEKENIESYTFGQMLKQTDAADFIHAMIKEATTMSHAITGMWYHAGSNWS